MPSTSITQQRLMGQAYALKTGELKYEDVLTYYMNRAGLYNGNVLNKGLSYNQIVALLTHT